MNPLIVSRKLLLVLAALLGLAFSSASAKELIILALGDSLTEGYGVEREEAYPFLLEEALRGKGHGSVKVINAGISGAEYVRRRHEVLLQYLRGRAIERCGDRRFCQHETRYRDE